MTTKMTVNIPNGRAFAGCNLRDGAKMMIGNVEYVYDEWSDVLVATSVVRTSSSVYSGVIREPSPEAAKPAKHSKYRNVRVQVDGMKFDSKAEAAYYESLKLLVAGGQVEYFLRQVPFHLPGGVKYVCDFAIQWANRSGIDYVDVKGMETAMFTMKKKMVESLYRGVTIRVVKGSGNL